MTQQNSEPGLDVVMEVQSGDGRDRGNHVNKGAV